MTVFSTVWKIVKKYKFTIILYTVILVAFAGFNFETNDKNVNFEATKPDIFIVNYDEEKGITKDLINHLEKNTNIIPLENDEFAINDALFYRDVNYIIYIPDNFRKDFLDGKNPKIEIKTTGDYASVIADDLLNNYIKTANLYLTTTNIEEELIEKINASLLTSTVVEVTSKLDTDSLSKISFYFNFLNYSILAGCVYVICLILASFKEKNISKRNIISSMSYKKLNRRLLIANGMVSLILWIFYIVLAFILLGSDIFTQHGILYIINSFIFMLCALSLAFLIGNIVNSKTAINGIINVVALGSSFLCGAFVPQEYLPNSVLTIAHMLPSYWYIKTNDIIKTLEVIDLNTLKPIIINMIVLIVFIIFFVIITNIISKKKQRIN